MWLWVLVAAVLLGGGWWWRRSPGRRLQARETGDWRVEMLGIINARRSKVGAPPLCLNAKLNAAAQAHSADQAARRMMTHTGSDGSNPCQRIQRAGYRFGTCGENVAQGNATVYDIMNGWMRSAPHLANMVNRKYRHVGLARVGQYWTQAFADGSKEPCSPPARP